ncbi:MAG TPA: hypothetical protein VNK52_13550 [Hyphomicrobiaceae bacterium]|nr:hypothetical protein [Hyphomicrobiaceae bacterium]
MLVGARHDQGVELALAHQCAHARKALASGGARLRSIEGLEHAHFLCRGVRRCNATPERPGACLERIAAMRRNLYPVTTAVLIRSARVADGTIRAENKVEMFMSKVTAALAGHAAPLTERQPRGFLASVLSAIVAWREAEAQRIVDGYLVTLSDERLRELGYDPAEVRAKGRHGAHFSAWS